MKTRTWMSFTAAAVMMLAGTSCNDDWGRVDPPAGNQVYPTLQNVSKITFEDEDGNPALPSTAILEASAAGVNPELLQDASMKSTVLATNGGSVTFDNPLNAVQCQKAASVSFFVKQTVDADDEGRPLDTSKSKGSLLSFVDGDNYLSIAADGTVSYKTDKGTYTDTDQTITDSLYMVSNAWHFVALAISDEGYTLVIDGKDVAKRSVQDFEAHEVVPFINNAAKVKLGSTQTDPILVEDLNIFRNMITEKEWKRPNKGNASGSSDESTLVYFNDFEAGLGDAKIVGGGSVMNIGGRYGNVFSNAMDGMRANYLLLPEDIMSKFGDTQQFSMSVWVNRGNETDKWHYMWSPLFMCYGGEPNPDNTWPMFACQYRGVLQFNCATWTDFVDGENVNGVNGVYHGDNDWLEDGNWHLYTVTMTSDGAKVYFDGVVVNEWKFSGEAMGGSVDGLWSNGADLKYICLGGNQAWNWGDPDPGFWFDDIAIYKEELTPAKIRKIMEAKQAVYFNDFETDLPGVEIVGEGEFIDSGDNAFGRIFSNAMNGMRQNYLLLPSDIMSKYGETKEFSMRVWVNRGNETDKWHYMWSPLFMCYGGEPNPDNTWPMFACQYRGVLQFNCATWTDFVDGENANGVNGVYHGDNDWLEDGNWHLYTVTLNSQSAKVYFDGELVNEWKLSGEAMGGSVDGLWSNGADLNYICLGGNQAWNWGDPDPGFWFDDFAVYDRVLTQSEIQGFVSSKTKK